VNPVKFDFYQEDSTIIINYGETFATLLKKHPLTAEHVLFLTNQRYYDLYSEKMNHIIPETVTTDWFVCTNQRYCNNLTVLHEVVRFTQTFPSKTELLIIGLGNEGVMELAGFLQANQIRPTRLWLIPASIRAFAQALSGKATLVEPPTESVVLQNTLTPSQLIFDQTLTDKQTTGKLVDLMVLVRCALVCDYSFLQTIFKSYSTKKEVVSKSFAGFIENFLMYQQAQGKDILVFGQVFTDAFYFVENGHMLSYSMKRYYGTLLHLLWTIQKNQLTFNYHNFLTWLHQLGLPKQFPAAISLAEYGEQVLKLAKQAPLLTLQSVGEVAELSIPTELELLTCLESFVKIEKEIEDDL
jgi:hypothetical protein